MYSGYRGFRGQRTYYETSVDGEADEQQQFYRYSSNWIVFSWFLGFGLVVFGAYHTFITMDALFHLFVIAGAVATGTHYYFTAARKPAMLPAMAFYNYLGFGALFCGLFLMLNMALAGPPRQQVVEVANIKRTYNPGGSMNADDVELSEAELDQFKYVIDFQQWRWQEFRSAKALRITYQPGFFGFRVYQGASLVKE